MKISLLVVGKTTDKHISVLIDDYVERVKHYNPFELIVIPELKNTKSLTEDQQRKAEAALILKQLQPSDHVVLLDERGAERRSMEFAQWMRKIQQTGSKRVVFVVGGPYGFDKEIYARANELMSLSRMTFSHQMVRLFFVEQIYRVFTIIKGEPYHHE